MNQKNRIHELTGDTNFFYQIRFETVKNSKKAYSNIAMVDARRKKSKIQDKNCCICDRKNCLIVVGGNTKLVFHKLVINVNLFYYTLKIVQVHERSEEKCQLLKLLYRQRR